MLTPPRAWECSINSKNSSRKIALWSTLAVVTAAQQLCLASAQNQAPLAQQDAAILQTARNQMAAAYGAAQTGAAAWQVKTVQPILDKVAHEAAAASS